MSAELLDVAKAFGEALVEIGEKNPRVVIVDPTWQIHAKVICSGSGFLIARSMLEWQKRALWQ